MPLFDFKCPACGHIEEVFVRGQFEAPVCKHLFREPRDITQPDDTFERYELGELKEMIFVMERQFPSCSGPVTIKGFSERNGYATPDERFKPSHIPGIKTQVKQS